MKKMVISFVTVLLFPQTFMAQDLKNVQVLPFNNSHEIVPYMKNMAKDLGVKCNYCHNMKDKSLDEIKHKLVAREMMRMVQMINAQMDSISTMDAVAKMHHWNEAPVIECWVCHRGKTSPETSRK